MKKSFYTIIFSLLLSLGLLAQTPLTEAVDFKTKDIHAGIQQLFTILDEDQQYVLIDFFSVTCGPCQTMAPMIDSVYHYFGQNEHGLYVMAIDQFFPTDMVVGFEEEYATHYPLVSGLDGGGDAAYEAYEIPYYPSLILIAPDHSIIEQAIPEPSSAKELIELLESHGLVSSSTSEIENQTTFNVFPNPSTDYIQIQSLSNQSIENIKIYSITGKEVLTINGKSSTSDISINVNDFQNGVYLISAEFKSGNRFSRTFIKK